MLKTSFRASLATLLMLAISNLAIAQYGGGGGTGSGATGGTYTPPKGGYGSTAAIIAGVAGGAALAGGLIYWRHHHNQAKLQGCLTGNGDKLVNEKDNLTYSLTNAQNETLKPGSRVELSGKKVKDAGEPTFEVLKMNKDLGQCTATTAMAAGLSN